MAVVQATQRDSARVIRLATPEDREAIVEFCRATWGPGTEDYIERVIDRWISGVDGALAVVDLGGRAVACCYVRLMSPREAFLAGMRVDPAHRRSGFSLALTEYCVRYAASHRRSVARVTIGWNNAAALGAIVRAGFNRVGSMTLWERSAEDPPAPPEVTAQMVEPSPHPLPGELWAVGWAVRELTEEDIRERIESGWALRRDGGLALLRPGEDYLWLGWLAGPADARAWLVRAAVQAAASAGFPRCRALLAGDAATAHALEAAGFTRGLEYLIYERSAR